MVSRIAPFLLLVAACCPPKPAARPADPGAKAQASPGASDATALLDPREVHFANARQLTFGGDNAEAYWSFAGDRLIFQSNRAPFQCDQIMSIPANGGPASLLSSGKGRTTCPYYLKEDRGIVYASTHEKAAECPTPPDMSKGYLWGLFDYDIYRADADGKNPVRLTDNPGYDAEATVCGLDGSILFTSMRDGDLELYRMDADGKNVARLTSSPGYDGGAFFSADCKHIVWRASRPAGAELEDYQRLLKDNLVRPSRLEIYVANADGSDARQITYLGGANFAPYFDPRSERVLFSSNHLNPRSGEFDVFSINRDGTGLERITYAPGFDGFDPAKGGVTTYPPGAKENGGIFLHTNPWVIIAETIVGRGDKAFDYYRRITPAYREAISDVHKLEPYVYAQMIAGKEAVRVGEAKNSWLTGTAAWNFVAVSQYLLGVRPDFDGLVVDPQIGPDVPSFTVSRTIRGARYEISVHNSGTRGSRAALVVDGVAIEGNRVPYAASGSVVRIEATL